jgi:hypothetical protein
MQRVLALASVVGAPRRLAVDSDDIGIGIAQARTQETKQSESSSAGKALMTSFRVS